MEQKKRDFLKESELAWEAAWVIDGWIGRVGHSAHPLCDLRNALGESAYTLAEKAYSTKAVPPLTHRRGKGPRERSDQHGGNTLDKNRDDHCR